METPIDLSQYALVNPEEHFANAQRETSGPVKIKRSEDPRFWKPSLSTAITEYQALARALPGDRLGKAPVSVQIDMHYLKECDGKVWLTIPCRKSLGKKECPICEANWRLWETNQKPLKDLAKKRMPQTTFIGNFLILNDLIRPAFNGTVRLWEHRQTMHDFIMAPMSKAGVVLTKPTTFGEKPVPERFLSYDPINGRNFVAHLNIDPKTEIPTYINSCWMAEQGPFTNDGRVMEMVMSQLHDLSEFVPVYPDASEVAEKFQEFRNKVDAYQAQQGGFGVPQQGFAPQQGFGVPQQGFAPQQGGFGAPQQGFSPQQGFAPQQGFGAPQQAAFPVQTAQGFAPQSTNAQVVIPGFNTGTTQTPVAVPGFNGAGFQQPAQGNSAQFFKGAIPASMNDSTGFPEDAPDAGGDDLPF